MSIKEADLRAQSLGDAPIGRVYGWRESAAVGHAYMRCLTVEPLLYCPQVIHMLKVGKPAPGFELMSDAGETVRLQDYRGRRVIVYFYPKADTPGCTKQACAIQDIGPQIRDAGVTVIGVSPDPPEKLARFREKYSLEFMLLSDPDHAVAEAYGAWGEKSMYGKSYQGILRSHAAVDEQGMIVAIEHNVKPQETAALWQRWEDEA